MKIHDLKPAAGSTRRRKRVGRGIAGKGGKTAGRGTKGQKARDTVPVSFEGGQLPMNMRTPKLKGFTNPFRVEYQAINLDVLTAVASAHDLSEINPATLHEHGLAHKGALVKVLGRGELTRSVTVRAHAFSKAAEGAITAAGGSVEVLPPPFGHGRPPAKGNAHTNR